EPSPQHRRLLLTLGITGRAAHQHTDPPHPLALLRARQHRPPSYRAAEQRDELAPLHSITSSARNVTDGGIVRFSAFAAFMSIKSSNLAGCSTGRSAGFAPLKILSMYSAARRWVASKLGPRK